MKFWETPKQSAYVGFFATLIGGICIGFGGATILFTRTFAELIPTLGPNLVINPKSYADLQLTGASLIFMGLLGCVLGIAAIHHSQKKVTKYAGT